MKTNEMNDMKEKINFYKADEIKVHISLTNNNWLNGLVMEVKEDKIIFLENKFGRMLILLSEIKDIVPLKGEVK